MREVPQHRIQLPPQLIGRMIPRRTHIQGKLGQDMESLYVFGQRTILRLSNPCLFVHSQSLLGPSFSESRSRRSRLLMSVQAASGCLPRLTLSPSSGRSVQNESDDSIVKPPTVRNVRCSAFVTATCSVCSTLPRYHAAMIEPHASPKLNDSCWQVLAMDVAML